jgi:hypothetical protein
VLATVLLFPQLAHLGENAADRTRGSGPPVSSDEINRRLQDMLTPIPDDPIDLGPPK